MTERQRGVLPWLFVATTACATGGTGGGGSDTNFLVCNDAGVCRWVTCPGPECTGVYIAPRTSEAPTPLVAEPEAGAGEPPSATAGVVTGETGSCSFSVDSGQCVVECQRDVGAFEASCTGPAGGAQSCTCQLNGVGLCDEASTDGSCYPWYADDCTSVAREMAAGRCEHIVDCCFSWSRDGQSLCSCTADPSVAGFASCEDAARAGGGDVVELCPRYEAPSWDFPAP